MILNRRKFIEQIGKAGGTISISSLISSSAFISACEATKESSDSKLKISLQAFSFAPLLMAGKFNLKDFPEMVRNTYQLDGAEYWSIAFTGRENNEAFLKELKQKSDDNGVNNTIILVDDLNFLTMEWGPSLASLSSEERSRAIDFHKVWVDTASKIGCHSIRINLKSNDGTAEEVQEVCSESISKLIEYSSQSNISIVIENHGGLTADAKWVTGLIKNIDSEFIGSLPDFGDHNFCLNREKLDLGNLAKPCEMQYDKYLGVKELLPYAKGISAKSQHFDESGRETQTDYNKMVELIKNSNYSGYIGIEYEGAMLAQFIKESDYLSPHEGVLATKALLEKLI